MIIKKHIETDLKRLNHLYLSSVSGADTTIPIFYSKLAVLELCGWIEESFDLIAKRAISGKLKEEKFKKLLESAIKENHGFDYEVHFLRMLSKIVGLGKCEQLHLHLRSTGKDAILVSELNHVKNQRTTAAHVPIFKTLANKNTFDAPSKTLARLYTVYPIIKEMYGKFC
jgi:hypothetical protein